MVCVGFFCITSEFNRISSPASNQVSNAKLYKPHNNFTIHSIYHFKTMSVYLQNCEWAITSNICDSSTSNRRCSCLWMSSFCDIWKFWWIHCKWHVEWSKEGCAIDWFSHISCVWHILLLFRVIFLNFDWPNIHSLLLMF